MLRASHAQPSGMQPLGLGVLHLESRPALLDAYPARYLPCRGFRPQKELGMRPLGIRRPTPDTLTSDGQLIGLAPPSAQV